MTNHPMRHGSPLIDLARGQFGRRSCIDRSEMRDFLAILANCGLDLRTLWLDRRMNDLPGAWTALCDNITTVSVIDGGEPASVSRSVIRYDQAGQLYPGFLATLMFAPDSLRSFGQIGLRRYCRRLFVVL